MIIFELNFLCQIKSDLWRFILCLFWQSRRHSSTDTLVTHLCWPQLQCLVVPCLLVMKVIIKQDLMRRRRRGTRPPGQPRRMRLFSWSYRSRRSWAIKLNQVGSPQSGQLLLQPLRRIIQQQSHLQRMQSSVYPGLWGWVPRISFLFLFSLWLQLKDDYKIVKELRKQSGFGWDNAKQLVTAPPQVWDSYLEVCLTLLLVSYTDQSL